MIADTRSAIERAFDRWDISGDQADIRKHENLMMVLARTAPRGGVRLAPRKPSHKWRRRLNDHHNDMRRARCNHCKGTGEIVVGDGYGCIEIDQCPACQYAYTGERIAGDVSAF